MAAKPTGVVVVMGLIPRLTIICKVSSTGSDSLVSMGSVHRVHRHPCKQSSHTLKKGKTERYKREGGKRKASKIKK